MGLMGWGDLRSGYCKASDEKKLATENQDSQYCTRCTINPRQVYSITMVLDIPLYLQFTFFDGLVLHPPYCFIKHVLDLYLHIYHISDIYILQLSNIRMQRADRLPKHSQSRNIPSIIGCHPISKQEQFRIVDLRPFQVDTYNLQCLRKDYVWDRKGLCKGYVM